MLFFANNRLQLSDHLQYYNQIWYQVAPLFRLSVYQISRQSDNFIANFPKIRKKQKKKKKKINQLLKVHISETPGVI